MNTERSIVPGVAQDGTPVEPVGVLATSVPGIVLWKWPRRTLTHSKTGAKKRTQSYTVTHEPSGVNLLPAGNGHGKACLTIKEATRLVEMLGDLPYRGKPVDWTQPVEVLQKIDRVRLACLFVAGWRSFSSGYDKPMREWAARNGIELLTFDQAMAV
jgi:hypothetical protein